MLIELALKIGDGQTYKDGMPLYWFAPGILIPWAEIVTFFQNGTLPTEWDQLNLNRQRVVRRRMREIKYCTDPGRTPADVARKMFDLDDLVTPTTKQLADAQKRMDQETINRARIQAHGYDSNWSHQDLSRHTVVMMDVPIKHLEDLIEEEREEDPLQQRNPIRRRAYRIPYENHFDAPTLALIRDPAVRVPVDRNMTPFTVADLERITT